MKKILCFTLVFMMALSCVGIAFATENEEHLPQIYVSGIGSRAVYEVGDPDKNSLFYPINGDAMLSNLGNFSRYAEEAIAKNEPDILYNCLYSWMWDTMGKAALDTDGISNKFNVTIDPCPLDYEGNGKYTFNYDSRLDPVDLAHQLYEYVGWVKEHSGQDRYELIGSSYGTSIIAAYMHEYEEEWDNMDSVLLCVPSLPGVDFVGELFSGTFNFDPDVLVDFVKYMVGNEDLDLLLAVLNKTGALEKILEYFLEPVAQVALLRAVNAIVHDIFGTFPSMWTFVQDEYFYAALERVYGEDYASSEHSHAKLIEKITYYHEEVMVAAPEIFLAAQKAGVHMNIIAKYGYPAMPFSNSGDVISDSLVDLEDATYGATCCMRGETLPEGYKQKLYPEYNMLSADGCVDASTCLLPFNTWIIKDLKHEEKPAEYWEMLDVIVYDNIDVNSTEKYPQFMQKSSTDGDKLEPMTAPGEKQETSLVQDCIRLLTRLIKLLTQLISNYIK